jgi:hypothetical protein
MKLGYALLFGFSVFTPAVAGIIPCSKASTALMIVHIVLAASL